MIARFVAWINRFTVCCSVLGMANAFKIQVRSRLNSRELKILLPGGHWFWFRGKLDNGVVSHFYTEGYHIESSQDKPIRRVLDCGANIGDETARFLIHQPQARIAAVEPARDNFRMLERNFASYNQIQLFHGAVWPCEAGLKVIPGNSPEEFRIEPVADSLSDVPAWTIPKLMEQLKWEEIDILKLDIEGAEYELFRSGFESWIDKINGLIFEVPDNPASAQLVFRALGARSFNTFICGENLVLIRKDLPWKLRKVVGFDPKLLLPHSSVQAACAPKMQVVSTVPR